MSDIDVTHTFCLIFFFFNDTATTEIYTLSLHDALPISRALHVAGPGAGDREYGARLGRVLGRPARSLRCAHRRAAQDGGARRNTAAHSRHLGGFPLSNAAGLRRGLPAAARGSRAPGAIQLCAARAPARAADRARLPSRSEEHTSEVQSQSNL